MLSSHFLHRLRQKWMYVQHPVKNFKPGNEIWWDFCFSRPVNANDEGMAFLGKTYQNSFSLRIYFLLSEVNIFSPIREILEKVKTAQIRTDYFRIPAFKSPGITEYGDDSPCITLATHLFYDVHYHQQILTGVL